MNLVVKRLESAKMEGKSDQGFKQDVKDFIEKLPMINCEDVLIDIFIWNT